MTILVLNCGSSSIKYQLINMETQHLMAEGIAEKIGEDIALFTYKSPNFTKKKREMVIDNHEMGLQLILEALVDKNNGVLENLNEIDAVGHRLVHAGEYYSDAVVITDHVIEVMRECISLAPLHNPANLKGIEAVQVNMPNCPQCGVFDTAFHQTMPDYAYMYAVPYDLYERYGVRRYGFHGTSHRYVSERVCKMLNMPVEGSKIITCHIGNGASITAVKDGKCMDTSMGLTPLEGLMMGSRSGDIDAGAVSFIMDKEGLNTTGISNFLNKKSGLLGVSGVSSDMREVMAAAQAGNKRAFLAVRMYFYRIRKYIGAYAAAMGGVDVLLFTGGVGENQYQCRTRACKGLSYMGVKLDEARNMTVQGEEAIISTTDSRVKVVVVPTDEELMIASDTMDILKK